MHLHTTFAREALRRRVLAFHPGMFVRSHHDCETRVLLRR